jgi:hypothetical protein
MNTAGNLAGGRLHRAYATYRSASIGWTGSFIASAAMLFIAGLLWFLFESTSRSVDFSTLRRDLEPRRHQTRLTLRVSSIWKVMVSE